MESRRIGKSDLITSCLGLGCMGMSAFYGPSDRAQNLEVLNHAVENGVTLFDTADMYGEGSNETLLGEFFANRSERISIATKVGFRTDPELGKVVDNTPTYIRQACENSLRRLRSDCIDLYYLHRRNPSVPIEESVGAMQQLVDEGKVRHIGLSEVSAETLEAATKEASIAALQIEYSLTERSPEESVIPAARANGVSVVAYSPLGRGLLTGRFSTEGDFSNDDFRPRVHPRLSGENLAANMEVIKKFDAIAAEIGLPKSSIALAWLLSRGEHVIPIPGTRSTTYLQQNIDATFAYLSSETLDRIGEIFGNGALVGERYNDAGMALLNH